MSAKMQKKHEQQKERHFPKYLFYSTSELGDFTLAITEVQQHSSCLWCVCGWSPCKQQSFAGMTIL